MKAFPYKIKLLQDNIPVYTGAGTAYVKIGSISPRDYPQIIEEKEGNGARLWGRLKSGAGWVPLDETEMMENSVLAGMGKEKSELLLELTEKYMEVFREKITTIL